MANYAKHVGWVQDTSGRAIANASVQVNVTSTGSAATIYSTAAGAALANPVISEADGSYQFYAANGRYDLVITKTGYTFDSDDTADITITGPGTDAMYVTPYQYGCVGDGSTDDTTNFSSAVTAAATNGVLLIPYGTFKLTSNVTIPATVQMIFTGNAKLSIQNGVTVVINGPLQANTTQIFSVTGTGTVSIGPSSVVQTYVQWWGATGDGSTDDTTAVQTAITQSGSITLFFPAGHYKTTAALTLNAGGGHIRGCGSGGDFVTYFVPTDCAFMTVSGVHHWLIENFMVWPQGSTPPTTWVTAQNSYSVIWRNVRFHVGSGSSYVPSTAAILHQNVTDRTLAMVYENVIIRTDGTANYPVIWQFEEDCGDVTLLNCDFEATAYGVRHKGGHITLLGCYVERCGVNGILLEASTDANASFSMFGGRIAPDNTAHGLVIDSGAKNVCIQGTWITSPGGARQIVVAGLTGSSNIVINIANPDYANIYPTVAFDPTKIKFAGAGRPLPPIKSTSINRTATTMSAGDITGAQQVVLISTNATPGNQQTRTAAQMVADIGSVLDGDVFFLHIANTGAGTLTLTAGSNVTLTGTMTVLQNTYRDFKVTFDSLTALTILNIGAGTYAA